MKLPAKVTISGIDYKVVKNPNRDGAHVNDETLTIEIGTFGGEALNNFLHETIEAILRDNRLRYRNGYADTGSTGYIFVFTHKEFNNIIPQIATAIKEILK